MLGGRGRGKIRAPRKGLYGAADSLDFDEVWGVLRSALLEIHCKNASSMSYEELYRHAYKLVLKRQGDQLYENVKEFEKTWLSGTVQPRITSSLNTGLLLPRQSGGNANASIAERRAEGERLLQSLRDAWTDHILCMNMITDVLMYMERVYCKDFRKPSIFVASMGQFRDFVLRMPLNGQDDADFSVAKVLNAVMLDQIQMERDGDVVDRALLKGCVNMLENLFEGEDEDEPSRLYSTTFEPEFLDASRTFYQAEGTSLLLEADASTFCRHAMRRAEEEHNRCRSTLSTQTSEKIKTVVESELIERHLAEVIALEHSGVHHMLDHDRLTNLNMIYELSARIDPEKTELRKAIQSRIVQLGSEINRTAKEAMLNPQKDTLPEVEKEVNEKQNVEGKTAEKPVNQQTTAAICWVDEILILKDRFDKVLKNAFLSDPILQTAITKSFSDFINDFDRSTENLSLFFDENMKKGIKGKTENEVDMLLDQGITLLGYISDKDMFERYYKKHLSKRLLMKRSVSMDAERQMISKMKLTVGNTFTQRIEKMFQDIGTSAELTLGFKEYIAALGAPDTKRVELDINVLTSTMWPQETMTSSLKDGARPSTCTFPAEIERIKHGFEKYYLGRHNGRQLTWQAGMGTADIRATFPESKGSKKTRELNVSTYAMCVLLLFNDLAADECITCEEIQARTNIPMHDLTRHLQSISVAPKTRILRKEPMSKDVKPDDRFFFNASYYSPFNRIKVNVPAGANRVEGADERSDTERKNDDERQGVIDAALVRIMKSRKELSHTQLIQELIQQLSTRFNPDVAMVKRRIESLIDREYLERLEREPPAYRYLA